MKLRETETKQSFNGSTEKRVNNGGTRRESERPTTSLFHILLNQRIVTSVPSKHPVYGNERPFSIDTERALEILPRVELVNSYDSKPAMGKGPSVERGQAELLQRAKVIFPQAEIALIVADLLPLPLHLQVDRLVEPEDIQITPRAYHRFAYQGNTFPKPGQQRGILEIGEIHQEELERKLQHMAKRIGIPLSAQAIRDISLEWGMSHEHGHAISNALQLIATEKKSSNNPKVDLWRTRTDIETHMYDTVHHVIAPDDELIHAVGDDIDNNSLYTDIYGMTSERIASGFELIGLEHALRSHGVSSTEIDSLLNIYKEDDNRIFQSSVDSFNYIRSKGLSLDTMGEALAELQSEFIKRDRSELLYYFNGSFGFRNLGYSKPLSKKELKLLVTQFGI